MNIDSVAISLANYVGKENVKKINSQKYAINTRLMLIDNFNNLTIYLVKIDNKLYFADFGAVVDSFDDPNLPKDKMNQFYKFLEKTQIEFENDERFIMETNDEKVYFDYNIFIMALTYIQTFKL